VINQEVLPLYKARYVVWIDYGSEGWKPIAAGDEAEAAGILTMDHGGRDKMVTRPLQIRFHEEGTK
jgi:hypothetical protein